MSPLFRIVVGLLLVAVWLYALAQLLEGSAA